jgi:hypothetical protein
MQTFAKKRGNYAMINESTPKRRFLRHSERSRRMNTLIYSTFRHFDTDASGLRVTQAQCDIFNVFYFSDWSHQLIFQNEIIKSERFELCFSFNFFLSL